MYDDQPSTIRMVPLTQLFLHPINPRQSVPDDDIEAMAQSIASTGLLQNLCAIEEYGRLGIVAGGRRLRGLQKLAAEGWTRRGEAGPIDPVPVQVTDDAATARAWALGENVTHSPLAAADEIRAYGQQAATGIPVQTIARAFGKTERHIHQRLRLAALPVEVLDLLAIGKIGLSTVEALCLSQDPVKQVALAQNAAARNLSAEQIRREISGASVQASDRRVTFLSIAAYEAAGGIVTHDLFTADAFLHDEALLDRLFIEKLEAKTDRIREDEGWAWAEICTDRWLSFAATSSMTRISPEPGQLPEADQAELDDLQETDDLSETDALRLQELEARAEGFYTDEQRSTAGVFCYVDHRGHLTVERAYQKRTAGDGGGDSIEVKGGGTKPALPQNAIDDMQRIRHSALQRSLLDQPELLLDLLAWQLASAAASYRGALGVTLSDPNTHPEKDSGFLTDERLDKQEDNSAMGWAEFGAFRAQGKKHRNQVLARGLARCVNGFTSSQLIQELAGSIGSDKMIRRFWTPDAANYFGRLRSDLQVAIWAELTGTEGDDLRSFTSLNKGGRAKELESLFADMSVREALGLSREQNAAIDAWLPAEMKGNAL